MKLAPCGITCATCPIRLATLEADPGKKQSMREGLAKMIGQEYGLKTKLEDIMDCDGCISGGRLFAPCAGCEIRSCALGRTLESCACCDEYCCDRLERHFEKYPALRETIEGLRAVT